MRSFPLAAVAVVAGLARAPEAVAQSAGPDGDARPKITLRAQPAVGMAPVRVVLTAELVGGSNDFEEYYCPGLEWDWGDDTQSESSTDCDPYESGKSDIRRRYSVEHVFRGPGSFRVYLRLKQRDKVVGATSVNVTVRPGPGDF
jgi:hypothetical protein